MFSRRLLDGLSRTPIFGLRLVDVLTCISVTPSSQFKLCGELRVCTVQHHHVVLLCCTDFPELDLLMLTRWLCTQGPAVCSLSLSVCW